MKASIPIVMAVAAVTVAIVVIIAIMVPVPALMPAIVMAPVFIAPAIVAIPIVPPGISVFTICGAVVVPIFAALPIMPPVIAVPISVFEAKGDRPEIYDDARSCLCSDRHHQNGRKGKQCRFSTEFHYVPHELARRSRALRPGTPKPPGYRTKFYSI